MQNKRILYVFGFVLYGVNSHVLFTIPFTTILAFIFSFITVYFLQNMPYLKYIVPK